MTSRIKSALLTRTHSIKRTTLSGVKDGIRSVRLPTSNDSPYDSNEYIHRSFFDDDNYQSIIKCLNDGYKVAMNLIEAMQGYCNLQHNHVENLSSYSKTWTEKLKQLSTLSSYNTTKRAQTQTLRLPNKLAQLLQSRCDAMQEVINTYSRQVERMYPSERLGTVHKHYQAEQLRKAFKSAYSAVSKVAEKLEKLHDQERQAKKALDAAEIECENLSLNSSASKTKIERANDTKEKRQDDWQYIENRIADAEKEYSQAQETYRVRAMEIYNECREYEKERLDQIRETLISFCQAAHNSDYSAEQDLLFEDLVDKIKVQQNSIEDLDFWASTYQVISAKEISSSETINTDGDNNVEPPPTTQTVNKPAKTENVTNAADTTPTPAAENDEQSAKNKQNKNKKSTVVDKKSSVSTEPTTPTTTKAS